MSWCKDVVAKIFKSQNVLHIMTDSLTCCMMIAASIGTPSSFSTLSLTSPKVV